MSFPNQPSGVPYVNGPSSPGPQFTQRGMEIYEQQPAYDLDPGHHMANLGDVAVYERVVVTPLGRWPMRGAQFMLAQQPQVVRRTTTVGTVLAVVSVVLALVGALFTCGGSLILLLGLLFLLMKEEGLAGPAIVVVRAGGQIYQAQVPLVSPGQLPWLVNNVNYCQALAAHA